MVDAAQLRDLQTQVENAPPAEALAASRKLVEILGPLAEQSPAKFLAQLATAWHDYGSNLGIVEGPQAAVEPLATAVRLFRDIANDSDVLSLLRLVQALQSLAQEQLALQRLEDAGQVLREAQETGQRLAQVDQTTAQLMRGKTCRLAAAVHQQRGDHAAAARSAREAEECFRPLVRKEPTVLPDFAAALKILAASLAHEPADEAAKKEAQKKIDEALVFHRSLAKHAPELFLGEFANTAYQTASILMARGKKLQAVGAYEHAADLYAKAAQADPTLGESYRIAATTTVEVYQAMGNDRRARKLRQRYGL